MFKRQLDGLISQMPVAYVATEKSVDSSRITQALFFHESGQNEAYECSLAKLESAMAVKAKAFNERMSKTLKANFLPVVGLLWNIYNTKDAILTTKSYTNGKDLLNITSNIAYVRQSVMSIWFGSAWDHYFKIADKMINKTNSAFKAKK